MLLARWLSGGGPAGPRVRITGGGCDDEPGTRRVALEPGEPARTELHRVLFTLDTRRPGAHHRSWIGGHLSGLSFPDHPEAVAGWALADLLAVREGLLARLLPTGTGRAALDGSSAVGPEGSVGPAVTLLLAYSLAADKAAGRGIAQDSLIGLARAGRLDGGELGRQAGALVIGGRLVLGRVTHALAEAVHAGAEAPVWEVLAALLPVLIGRRDAASPDAGRPPTGLADVLALAADIAVRSGRRAELAGLSELAGSRGSSKTVVQARRLQQALAP